LYSGHDHVLSLPKIAAVRDVIDPGCPDALFYESAGKIWVTRGDFPSDLVDALLVWASLFHLASLKTVAGPRRESEQLTEIRASAQGFTPI
jgi:hypothetical protein